MTARAPGFRPLVLAPAVLAGAAALDLLGSLAGAPALWIAGAHLALAGIAAAGIALAVAVARRGARRRVGSAVLGVLALALYALARWVRGAAAIPPDPAVLLVEPIAVALLWLAGRLGRPAPPLQPEETP